MKTYTEQDIRKAFQAGNFRGAYLEANEYAPFTIPFDEDDYIENLNEKEVEEDKVSFTYSFLRRKLDWMDFCELTGTNEWAKKEGREFKDDEIFYTTESKAKQFNLI